MILEIGAKVLVVHRRLFDTDDRRYFIGKVLAYEQGIVKLEGQSWSWHHVAGTFVKKPDPRTRLIAISSGSLLVYELPSSVVIDALKLRESPDRHLLLGDGKGFEMDLTERLQPPHSR